MHPPLQNQVFGRCLKNEKLPQIFHIDIITSTIQFSILLNNPTLSRSTTVYRDTKKKEDASADE